jgi:hypothetical protein
VPLGQADTFGQACDIEEKVLAAAEPLGQPAIEPVDQVARRSRQGQVETSKARFDRPRQSLKNADRVAAGPEPVADRVELFECRGYRLAGARRVARHRSKGQAAIIEGEEHGVGPGSVDGGSGIQRLLNALVELPSMHSSAIPWRAAVAISGDTR